MNGFTDSIAVAPAVDFNPLPTVELSVVSNSVANWVAEINALLLQGRKGTIQLARSVHTAKAKLPYGYWSAIWKSGQVPFSKRKAEMLAVVGKNLGWADAQTFAHLPSDWSALYYLAQLDQVVFKTLLEQGANHPALTLQESKDFLAVSRGRKTVARKPKLIQWLKKFSDFVRAHLSEWSIESRDEARSQLIIMDDELGGVSVSQHVPSSAGIGSTKLLP